MSKNFFIYVDKGGKCPVLSQKKLSVPSHPFWVRYVNDRPVAYHGPKEIIVQNISGDSVWDYALGKFVPIENCKAE
jgi:hypothetical protein